ncbi:hypothetical protein [Janthinobacterium sp. B9-8]|uniref:hypothetical protein n=1 Tax=Janthinobacterium sp. B9-8 TaxID=1236179 RepID=UPI00061D27F4|nr:hypothetical protein [Janthinobacterium sp. B9-8]AMC35366.1 hypothetical protein VN23_12465 [Janthinobacterium sp. B9-8]
MMNYPKILPTLPHVLHEWIEIQVWQQDRNTFVVSGSYSQDGLQMHIYNDALIASYSTHEEAIEVGKAIARQASAARLIASLPFCCSFKEGEP